MNDNSNLVEAINGLLGMSGVGLAAAFPPAILLLPVFFAVDAVTLMTRISPMESERLMEAAVDDERALVATVIRKAQGRPSRYALWRLSMQLVKKAEREVEEAALARLKTLCE